MSLLYEAYNYRIQCFETDSIRFSSIKCSYGSSDLTPEDAILQLMMGNPAEEHDVDPEDLATCILECGKVYHLAFAGGSEHAALIVITDNFAAIPTGE